MTILGCENRFQSFYNNTYACLKHVAQYNFHLREKKISVFKKYNKLDGQGRVNYLIDIISESEKCKVV